MSTSFEQIKDAGQLQDYLTKHAAAGGQIGQINVKPKDASPAAHDYTTLREFKASNRRSGTAGPNAHGSGSDRYQNNGSKRRSSNVRNHHNSNQLRDLAEE